jgi:hypothetical protein
MGDALVAVGLPHHHGVGVGGLAGGDHGGLVEDGGDSGESGHGDVRIKSDCHVRTRVVYRCGPGNQDFEIRGFPRAPPSQLHFSFGSYFL